MSKPITPDKLDRLLEGKVRPAGNNSRIIWTLGAIGQRIGAGPDFVRDTLAKQEGSPVKEIGGRYYAFEDDLMAFLRFKD